MRLKFLLYIYLTFFFLSMMILPFIVIAQKK